MSQPPRAQSGYMTSILVEAGVVTPEQIEAGLVRQRETGRRIGETLVELGAVTEEDIGWALARQLGITFVDVRPETLDRELIASFPAGLLHRLDALPLIRSGGEVSVAMADPTDGEAIDALEAAAGAPIAVSIATPSAIRRVLAEILGPPAMAPPPRDPRVAPAAQNVVWERSGTTFVLFHVTEARHAGAQEIHFVPESGELRVYHRLGRELALAAVEPEESLMPLLARIAALGGPALAPRQSEHLSGRIVCPGASDVAIDVSLLAGGDHVTVTFAFTSASGEPIPLERLGLEPVDLARLREILERPTGLIAVGGPPRSGRSTLLAGLLAAVPTGGRRLLSLGGGVHNASSVRGQTLRAADAAIPAHAAADVAAAWREIAVGQCADIVVLDDVLSGDAVSELASAACAGRRVLATTDWTDSFALLEHWSAHVRTRASIAARIQCLLQSRRVCGPGGAGRAASGAPAVWRSVYEVLFVTDAMRDALSAGVGAFRLRELARADRFRSLEDVLLAATSTGLVSADEAARALS